MAKKFCDKCGKVIKGDKCPCESRVSPIELTPEDIELMKRHT